MRYDAFISYRHSELDLYIAKKLHKGLETFKVPRAIAKRSGKKNIKRVFRDQEELPIGSDLGDNIETALAESEFLLVICSPRTPESYWVRKEIETFIKLHDREHVLAVLIEGEPDQSFPAELLTDDEGNPVEPLAADVRGGSGREIDKKLKSETVRLAAPLLGCSYDDLRQRHRERKMKKAAAALSAVAVAAILFGAYSTYNAVMIQQNYEGKQRNQSKYLADTSLDLLEEGDRRAAVLVALEALPGDGDDKPYVAEAQYALSQALYCYDREQDMKPDRILQHEQPVSDFWLSQDAAMAVTIDQGNNVYVWEVDSGRKLLQIPPTVDAYGFLNEVKGAIICGDSVVLCGDEYLRAVSFDGQENWYVENPDRTMYCEFDEEAMRVACVGNEQVNFYDISSGELIGSMSNDQEESYTLGMAFDEGHTKFAVPHRASRDGNKTGCISIYDFGTRKVMNVETAANSINDIAFTTDGHLAVSSLEINDLFNYDQVSAEGYLEKINFLNGEVLWQNTFEYQVTGYESAGAHLITRSYTDEETGKRHEEVLMSIDDTAYTWDNATGDLIAQARTDSGIAQFLASVDNGFAFLAGNNGTVDIVDMTEGFRYSAFAIQTNSNLRDVSIRNGVLAVRAFASPDLKIFRHHKNADLTKLENFEDGIKSIRFSADETYYAVDAYDPDLKVSVFFYRTKDNSPVGMWNNEEGKMIQDCRFVDDTVYVIVCSDGSMYFYDIESGKEEELQVVFDRANMKCCFNEINSRAFLYSGRQCAIVDLKQRRVLQGEAEGSIQGGILSEDGKKAYCSIMDQGVCILDLETGDVDRIEAEGYQTLNIGYIETAFAVSGDGRLLAVCCQDNVLRVLDMEKMTTIAEIPFAGVKRRMLKFSEDCRQVMMQGDDYYFRVYDLEREEFVHVSIDQYNEIREIVSVGEDGTVSLETTADMIILNRDDYERIARIEGGRAYLPKNARILSSYDGQIYQFPYMTLEMLREEAQAQFAGEELTELEKTRFHVE